MPQRNAERHGGDKGVTHACELENLSSEIFEDGGNVDGGLGANTHLVLGVCLEETLDTTAGELEVVKVSDQVITGRDSEWTDASAHVKPTVEFDAVCAIRRRAVLVRDAVPSPQLMCLKSRIELGTAGSTVRAACSGRMARACRRNLPDRLDDIFHCFCRQRTDDV